jgi:putative ABC transport system permease protein
MMLHYYLRLALKSLRRSPVLTALMIAAIGVGIGASMTVFTLFRAMSGDPIPDKSAQLYVPQIDNFGPEGRDINEPPEQLSYRDAVALMQAHAAPRQTALYQTGSVVLPADSSQTPSDVMARAVYADFFPMFEVPFRFGGAWSAADDEAAARLVVIGAKLNDRLFHGENSVGRTLNLDGRDYRVLGVLQPWDPRPRVYDVISSDNFAETEDVFLPFSTAIAAELSQRGNRSCNKAPAPGWQGALDSECVWIQFWVELPTASDVARYRTFLDHYAAEQQRQGRFGWPPLTRLRGMREWLVYQKVVTNEIRITVLLALGFLLVCLVNAVGLMLAKFSGRAGELGVRRALGASKRDVFLQCLVETAVIGVAGGLLGLALTLLGLIGERAILPRAIERLAHLDAGLVLIAMGTAIVAAICAGLYPTWRASGVQPGWQLKSQ